MTIDLSFQDGKYTADAMTFFFEKNPPNVISLNITEEDGESSLHMQIHSDLAESICEALQKELKKIKESTQK